MAAESPIRQASQSTPIIEPGYLYLQGSITVTLKINGGNIAMPWGSGGSSQGICSSVLAVATNCFMDFLESFTTSIKPRLMGQYRNGLGTSCYIISSRVTALGSSEATFSWPRLLVLTSAMMKIDSPEMDRSPCLLLIWRMAQASGKSGNSIVVFKINILIMLQ